MLAKEKSEIKDANKENNLPKGEKYPLRGQASTEC